MLMIVLMRRSCRISPLLVTSLSTLNYKSSKEITFRLIIIYHFTYSRKFSSGEIFYFFHPLLSCVKFLSHVNDYVTPIAIITTIMGKILY